MSSAALNKWEAARQAGTNPLLAEKLAAGKPDNRGVEAQAIFLHRNLKPSGDGKVFSITTVLVLSDIELSWFPPRETKAQNGRPKPEIIQPAKEGATYHIAALTTLTLKEFQNWNDALMPKQIIRLKGLKYMIKRDTKEGSATQGMKMFNVMIGQMEAVPGATLESTLKQFPADQRYISSNGQTSRAEEEAVIMGDDFRASEYVPGRAVIFDFNQNLNVEGLQATKKFFCAGSFTEPADVSWLVRKNKAGQQEMCLRGAADMSPNVATIAQGGAERLKGQIEVVSAYITLFHDDFQCLGLLDVLEWQALGLNFWKGCVGKYVGATAPRTSTISANDYDQSDNQAYVQGSAGFNLPETMKSIGIELTAAQAMKFLQSDITRPTIATDRPIDFKQLMRPGQTGVNLKSVSGNMSKLVKAENVKFHLWCNHQLTPEALAALQALPTPEERMACVTKKANAKVAWVGASPIDPNNAPRFKFAIFATTTDESPIRPLLEAAAPSTAALFADEGTTEEAAPAPKSKVAAAVAAAAAAAETASEGEEEPAPKAAATKRKAPEPVSEDEDAEPAARPAKKAKIVAPAPEAESTDDEEPPAPVVMQKKKKAAPVEEEEEEEA